MTAPTSTHAPRPRQPIHHAAASEVLTKSLLDAGSGPTTFKLKDVRVNPFRNIDRYPISPDKIEALRASIQTTGFWGNIVARAVDGGAEIVYGHHRLWEAIYDDTKHGGDSKSPKYKEKNQDDIMSSWSEHAAEALGVTPRTVQRRFVLWVGSARQGPRRAPEGKPMTDQSQVFPKLEDFGLDRDTIHRWRKCLKDAVGAMERH